MYCLGVYFQYTIWVDRFLFKLSPYFMHDKGKSLVIKDGVRLYKQSRSKYWWAAVRIDGEEVRKSTKTTDETDAMVVALEIAAEAKVKVAHGIALRNVPSFKEMANRVINQLETTEYGKDNDTAVTTAIRKYLVPYLGRKPINKVGRPDIHEFYQWRQPFWQYL